MLKISIIFILVGLIALLVELYLRNEGHKPKELWDFAGRGRLYILIIFGFIGLFLLFVELIKIL